MANRSIEGETYEDFWNITDEKLTLPIIKIMRSLVNCCSSHHFAATVIDWKADYQHPW